MMLFKIRRRLVRRLRLLRWAIEDALTEQWGWYW